MGEQVELNENGSETYKQLNANFDIVSTSSEIMLETLTMNGAFKAHINGGLKDLKTTEGCADRSQLLENQKVQKHRPLTFLRIFRGLLCLMVLVCTAFMTLIMFAPITFLALRLFSVRYSRKATSFLFGHWLAMWPFLFEKINKTKVVFSGDHVPERERILLLCNHRTEVDWMYIWNLALRKDRLGYIKYVLKSSVRNAPIFGWGFHVLEFILVERKWELDEPVIESMLSTFKDPQDPLWLVLFPEGTDFTEAKCLRSQQFAEEHDLPILKNVLLPRTKGFHSCLTLLRSSLDAVYDVTVGYKYQCPLFMDNAFGVDPAEVHIHVRRVPLSEIPTPEDEAAAWLVEAFRVKDELLSDFSNKGCFPNSGTEEELPTFKCILNFAMMIILTGISLTSAFHFSVHLKIYVALSCVYLAAATYFNVRPTPIFNCLKGRNTSNLLNRQDIH